MSGHRQPGAGPRRWWRRRVAVIAGALAIASLAALVGVGLVPHRQWNLTREESVRVFDAPDGGPRFGVCVVELDDQGVAWDRRQLGWTLDHLAAEMASHERGVIVFVMVPGWKADGRWREDRGNGLAGFRRSLERLSARAAAAAGGGELPGLVGVYIGWRGSSSDLPVLGNLTFWNRRVAAHRAASVDLREVLLQVERVAGRDLRTKVIVVGHSMGGLIANKALYPLLEAKAFVAAGSGRPLGLGLDLLVSLNPALSALEAATFEGFLERNRVRLVNRLGDGSMVAAEGPLLASISSRLDLVSRVVYPVGMWLNGLPLRYRAAPAGGGPSQRQLGRRATGHEPSRVTHEATVVDGEVELHRLEGRAPPTPYWIIRVGEDISAGHSEVDGARFSRLLFELMDRNRLFDPEVELMLEATPPGP